MGQSFFIWNGIDCRAKGIIQRGPAPIIRAEERINHVTIPGRSGDLTETEGKNIYNSYIQTVTISVVGGYRVREVYKWLRGSGRVTFSGEPDKVQDARIIGAITLNKISKNMDSWSGEVQFYCQPLKKRLREVAEAVTTSGTVIRNNGDVRSRPMWKVTASGSTVTLTAAGADTPEDNTIEVDGLTSGDVIWIDSDTMEVWNEDKSALITKDSTGEFPMLGEGENTISGSGWSRIEIEKRERYL